MKEKLSFSTFKNISPKILEEGRNCWRIARSERVAFLVDAASYFSAFAAAAERAERSILIVGWDIDSRVSLVREQQATTQPIKLGEFLNTLVSKRRGLHAHVLIWDFAMIYAFSREPFSTYTLGWRTHRRLHFQMDGKHPLGASHHQKIVVVDDAVAFVGGIDLTKCRWDTPEHLVQDERRQDPGCGFYAPFHDIQMIVDGKAASLLGDVVRARWRRATGHEIKPPKASRRDIWPPGLTPDVQNVHVGIARTEPAYMGKPEIREIESLYRDAINSARRFIYVESQYFTSLAIAEVLTRRLQEKEGPEVVLILPVRSSGRLEEITMDALRVRLLRQLLDADRFGRLRLYHPVVPGNGNVNLHSKTLVIDDQLVRIGSSNMSNRSMGLDTECDLTIEANGDIGVERSIAAFLNRLLAEHLGVSSEEVFKAIDKHQSLVAAIEQLRGSERTLQPLDGAIPDTIEGWIYDSGLIDPDRPTETSEVIHHFVPEEVQRTGIRHVAGSVLILAALLGLTALWYWTPLNEWLSIGKITAWAEYIGEKRFAPLIVIAAFTVGGLLMFPVTMLIVATALTFHPVIAFLYSMLGCLSSAVVLFGIGHIVGRDIVQRIAGPRLSRLNKRLQRQGLITVVVLRIVPVAPYSVVNFVTGASHIGLRDFVIGTFLGLIPGLFAITVLGERLDHTIRHPELTNFVVLAFLVLLIASANIWVRRWLGKNSNHSEDGSNLENGKN